MEPIRTTEVALQFAAALSPWWLLALVPLAVAAGLWLVRGQGKDLPRLAAAGLVVLRCVLLAGLVFLLFRPSVLRRSILTFPGRVVLLLDDSESMAACDTGLEETDALRWSRTLDAAPGGAPAACHALAQSLGGAEERLRRFQRFAQSSDRATDGFWAEAERAGRDLSDQLDGFVRLAGTATGLAPEERRQLDEILARVPEWRSAAQPFLSGDRNPAARAYDAYAAALAESRARLLVIQAALDRRALADASGPLHERVKVMRSQPRLALLARSVAALQHAPQPPDSRTGYPCVSLMTGATRMLPDLDSSRLATAPGSTDLLGALDRLLREESPFPLAGIVVFSDGRHLGGGLASETARLAAQKQVPIHVAAMGAAREPFDLAILDVAAPPFAVKGAPTTFRVRLKTVLPEPAEVRVEALCRGKLVAGEALRVGTEPEANCALRIVPPETGRFRYTVQVTALASERLPARNNRRDVVLGVREDKLRVLLLDGRPRWETRFFLNILQRLDYLDLNSIVLLAQEGGKLARGVRKGTWPKDRETLALYDLVILGEVPPDLLTTEEWAMLREVVEARGQALAFLGSRAGTVQFPRPELTEALWPVRRADGARPGAASGDGLDGLCVTEVGRRHPLTAAIGDALASVSETGVPRLRPDTRALALAAPGGEPLLTARLTGRGKVLLLEEDRLWKRLNPSLLSAHAALVVNLVSWAADGDSAVDAGGKPSAVPCADQHVFRSGDDLLVWMPSAESNVTVEALAAGAVVQAQPLRRPRPDADWACAVFRGLPPQDIQFRRAGRPDLSGTVFGVESGAELGFVGRQDSLLAELADESGGSMLEFPEAGTLLAQVPPRERVEKRERIWRLWDAKTVFAFLLLLLTAEWVWRKWVGLV